jgi:ribonuclease P protein component
MSLRLPKPARLGRSGEFARVKSAGISFPGRYFVLAVLRPEQLTEELPRVGLITSKRVGNSVVRHRVRRLLREVFRLGRPLVQRGLWLVLIARAKAATATMAALQAEWGTLGKRAGIFLPEVENPGAMPA